MAEEVVETDEGDEFQEVTKGERTLQASFMPLHRVEHAATQLVREEIRGVTWDLGGWKLYPRQKAQYAHAGGFKNLQDLYTAIATFDGESGGYLEAWHINVARNEDGTILRDEQGRLLAKSVDLGWIQKNVDLGGKLLSDDEAADFVEEVFTQGHPELARPLPSATTAYEMFLRRGWDPWYAYTNGGYKRHLGNAALAVGNYIAFKEGYGSSYLKVA